MQTRRTNTRAGPDSSIQRFFFLLCVSRSHALPNHASAQSEESQLPASVAHHRLGRAPSVQQHGGQGSGVHLQEEQDALQLCPLPLCQRSRSARNTSARPTL